MAEIILRRRRRAAPAPPVLVDDEDFDWLNQHAWYLNPGVNKWTSYAQRTLIRPDGGKSTLYMHRDLMARHEPIPEGMVVDHINRNGLDNRRSNLRLATLSQNNANSRGRSKRVTSSRYRGVHGGRWTAMGQTGSGSRTHLGIFDTEEEAARAWDHWASEQWGEFAVLNFPKVQI